MYDCSHMPKVILYNNCFMMKYFCVIHCNTCDDDDDYCYGDEGQYEATGQK